MPSKSKQQQKFMGMAHALKKGEMKPSDASPELKRVAKSMSDKDVKDFASTSHKGLPKKVKQEIVKKLKELNESVKKSDYLNGLKDLQKAVKSEKGSFQGNNGGKVAKLYYEKALKMGMDNKFIDNLTRKRINAYNKKAFSLSGGSLHTAVVGGIGLLLKNINEYATKMGKDHMGGDSIPSQNKGGLRDNDGYDNVDYNRDMPMDEACWKGYKQVGGKIKNGKQVPNCVPESVNEGMFSTIDQIRQNSKSVRDFIKNVLSDKEFRDMKSDKDFIKYLGSIYEGKLPNNWMSGRTSDYHTKLRGKKREYDDTNFEKDNSGQPDLEESFDKVEHLKLLNLALRTMPDSQKQKEIIRKLNKVRVAGGMRPLKEDLSDVIYQVKKFEKPKDEKLLTIKVINKLKDMRNKSKSSSNKQKLQKMIDKIEGDYKKGKFLNEAPIFNTLNNPRFKKATKDLVKNKKVKNPDTGQDVQLTTALKDKEHPAHNQAKSLFKRLFGEYASKQTLSYIPADEEEIEKMNETMIRRVVDIAQELLPKDTWSRYASDGKKNAEFVKNIVRDLARSLNQFYKNHNINVRIQK